MARVVFILLIFLLLLGETAPFGSKGSFSLEKYLYNAYAQPVEKESSKRNNDLSPAEEPWMRGHRDRMMMREGMRTPPEDMRKMMREVISPKEVPFYQGKTFLVTVTVAFILIIAWMIKRWGIRPWRALRRQGPFVNEAILVVDLCESTKLAVTQGDAFAMRIKNKMKECVREVSESFGAKFFESIGDGYLITFPRGIEAVRAAIKILQNADDYNRDSPEKEKIELRVGINYGEMILDEQGGRHGAAINKAFRIEGLMKEQREILGSGLKPEEFPEKNRILVSEEVKEELSRAEGIQVQLAGVFNLKGFTALHRIYCIPWKDVAAD